MRLACVVLDGVLGEVSMQEGGCIASPSSSSVDLFSMLGESDDVTFSVVRWHHAMRHWLATTTAWDEGKDARCEKKNKHKHNQQVLTDFPAHKFCDWGCIC